MKDRRRDCPDSIGRAGSTGPVHHGPFHGSVGPSGRLLTDRRGSIAIVAAVSMMMLIAVAALALDLGNLYLARLLDQRIADQSALAAAFAYSQSGSTTTAQKAASSIATANGAGSATVNATITTSPSGDGSKAAMTVVTSVVSLSPFGLLISQQGVTSMTVSATSYAEIQTATPCVIALAKSSAGGTGIAATAAPLTATGCEVSSNYNVSTSNGGAITASSIYAVGTISGTVTGTQHPSSSTQADPFASSGIFSRMSTVAALSAPGFPSVGSAPSGGSAKSCSSTLTVASGSHGTITGAAGCTTITFSGGAETDISGSGISLTGSTTTMNFAAGTYKINGINISGSANVTVNVTGTVVFDVWNGFTVASCSKLTVNGPATYNVQGGLWDNNGSTCTGHNVVFSNANGSSTSTFNVVGGGNENALTVTGNSATFPAGTYTLVAESGCNGSCVGLSVGSGAVATFGNGSYMISGQDGGISVATTGKLTIGSQADDTSVFQITGIGYSYDDAIYTGSSGTLTIGSFTNVDLNGTVDFVGTANLGAGIYTINGEFDACDNGANGSLTASSVSIIASGTICFGQGYTPVSVQAPTAITGSTVGSAATIALATSSTTAVAVTSGATDTTVAGAFYVPNAALTVNGGGKLWGGSSGCLQIIAMSLTFSSDSNGVSTSCASLGGSAASSSVTLVQ